MNAGQRDRLSWEGEAVPRQGVFAWVGGPAWE